MKEVKLTKVEPGRQDAKKIGAGAGKAEKGLGARALPDPAGPHADLNLPRNAASRHRLKRGLVKSTGHTCL